MKMIKLFLALLYPFLVYSACSQTTGSFTDVRDDRDYKFVTIGNQVWMAENLYYVTEEGSTVYSSLWGNNADDIEDYYGRLYLFESALNACPDGWQLPSDDEWTELTNYLGGELEAGGKMKTTGTTDEIGLWQFPNKGATNESGFSAVPAGYRNSDGNSTASKHYAIFWSSTTKGMYHVWCRELTYQYANVKRHDKNKGHAYSVRCIKDEDTN